MIIYIVPLLKILSMVCILKGLSFDLEAAKKQTALELLHYFIQPTKTNQPLHCIKWQPRTTTTPTLLHNREGPHLHLHYFPFITEVVA